jgi:hypothetical protein
MEPIGRKSLSILWDPQKLTPIASFGAAIGSPPHGSCGLPIAAGTVPASRLASLASAARVQESEQEGRRHATSF